MKQNALFHIITDERYWKVSEFLHRDDIIVSQLPGKGVSKSRNNVVRLAKGEIGLSSDDMKQKPEYIERG